jgi:hypothetical protein
VDGIREGVDRIEARLNGLEQRVISSPRVKGA